MNWSLAQRFKDGKLLTSTLLGYDRAGNVTGRFIKYAPLVVNEKEAEIVRFIFDAYIAGADKDFGTHSMCLKGAITDRNSERSLSMRALILKNMECLFFVASRQVYVVKLIVFLTK